MRIKHVYLYITEMKLRYPFATSYGTYEKRQSILLEVQDDDGRTGWGEVVAFSEPWYTEETIQTAWHILKDFLIPALKDQELTHPSEVPALFAHVKRNHMAKAGLEGAVWDLYAQQCGISLANALGGTRSEIEVGVVIGINPLPYMLEQIAAYREQGYARFKVKIKPGQDYDMLVSIRDVFPDIPLMADANSAYTLQDIKLLQRLDDLDLMMIEQPLADHDFLDHARLQNELKTPICLDESIHSLEDARVAVTLGSCRIVNIKAGRVGGLTESVRIHDYCKQHNIAVWCGGMIETGISRAQNIALASLNHFTIPGDISASERHWERDVIIPSVRLHHGKIQVPKQIGLGFQIDREYLNYITIQSEHM
ncbi:o-succinylbenzoate synthase [Ectobacillus antri]|jgi:O-succinylbenzoate synthase|uniref:o-succinylbenzoate synthase n=1 Tax=Ectobacillus antri TaxID=2486280 RepID=A0ABT6H245_9BACI|nr:o-succinylbenzoate synthase [Ectobacillus antri]MDG4656430.1 o-succinylbenzoate synthase [Ectobacillus antri]MDG5753480.1 o-succinylbenzoate synthase [Ectobacillus antri]